MRRKVKIYVVPFLDWNYNPAYDLTTCCRILRALAITFKCNTVIGHNITQFDAFILAWKYKIPVGRNIYDTMLATHRTFPTVEKSLGHLISLWTYQLAHKHEGVFAYNTEKIARQLWENNGKDVFVTLLVKLAIDRYAKTISGLTDSISQANKSIYPYLLVSLLGMSYDKQEVENKIR